MIYSNVKTFYVNTTSDSRLIRYDVIKISEDIYRIKVIDNQQQDLARPQTLIQIDDFEITREQYEKEYAIGNRSMIRQDSAPTFEGTIADKLQDHRNKL